MKQIILITSLFIFGLVNAQSSLDSIEMGPGYTNDVFYSFTDGSTTEVGGSDWTVAFYNEAISAAVMINSGRGVRLFKVSDDISTFSNVLDTADMGNWEELYDDFTLWDEKSAFEDKPTTSPMNYGWGQYNTTSHKVEGSRVFVLQTISEEFFKVIIEDKTAGTFTYRYASLDNSFDTTFVVTTPDYLNKNYVYLNMENHTVLNFEPNNTTWDVIFKKYMAQYGPTTHYPVTGVLSNVGVEIVKIEDIPVADSEITDGSYSSDRNAIGFDWKSFNNSTFEYNMQDSLSYFVKTKSGVIYKFYFTKFEGSSTGKVVFKKERIEQQTSINDLNKSLKSYTVYPNPTRGNVELVFDADKAQNIELNIFDLQGRSVANTRSLEVNKGLNAFKLNLTEQNNGVYFIQLNNGKNTTIRKVILQK